jgi:hypothetical protein
MVRAKLLANWHALCLFMVITLILVACCPQLNLIYAARVLYCKFYLNMHVRVTLKTLHQLDLIVFCDIPTSEMRGLVTKIMIRGLLMKQECANTHR